MSGDVRAWNLQIRSLVDKLPGDADHTLGFGCECGCGKLVALTARQFDNNGAWADGHKPDDSAPDLEAAPAIN